MAKFRFFNGNQGFYRQDRLNTEDYDLTAWNTDGATLIYNGNDGLYEPTRSPHRIDLTFSGAKEHTYEEGPNAGGTIFTDGKLSAIRYYDDTGQLLLRATGLDIDLAWIDTIRVQDSLWNLGQAVYAGGHKFVGSNDSSGPFNDWGGDDITTGTGNDNVKSKGGDDYIKDRGGQDKYDGGKGDFDTISYDECYWNPRLAEQGIRADLSKGKIVGYDGLTDTVKNIENVRGTFMKDSFKGDGGDNNFMGLQGRDFCDGRGGFDTVSFRRDADQGGYDGAKVNLKAGWARDGFGHRDRLKNIEGAEGTDNDDTFIGNNQGNYFRGRDGGDTFDFVGRKFGHDVIADYDDSDGDLIRIRDAASMANLNIYQDGNTAVVEFAKGRIDLWDFDANDLDANDFVFG